MGSFSNYLEDKVLNHIFGKSSYTQPTIYVGLSSADPTEDGSGIVEPSGGGYARVQTAASHWATSSGGATTNAQAITFAESTGSWGSALTHFFLSDALTGGNMLAYGSLYASRTVNAAGYTPRFLAGELDVTLT